MGWFSKKKDDTAPGPVMSDSWNMFIRWMDENREIPVFMFFDETYAEQRPDDYNDGVELRLILNADQLSENGVPLPQTNLDLQSREDELVRRIEHTRLHVKYTARLVGAGGKTYRFQSRDGSALTPLLEQWAGEIPYLRKSEVKTEKKWGFYERIIPNGAERMQISDRNLIETLLTNGAKEDTLYTLDFTFTGPSDKLDIIQKDLEEESFTVSQRESNLLVLQRELPLDLETIYQFTLYMLMSSVAHDCRYDGWGCNLKPAAQS